MKRLFLEHYLLLDDLFVHFSGSTGRDSSACMVRDKPGPERMPVLTPQALHQVQSEFAAFLNYSRLAPTVAHGPAITKVFIAANADRNNDEDNDEARLTRFEFFEALLMMAMYRFGRGGVICDGAGQVS